MFHLVIQGIFFSFFNNEQLLLTSTVELWPGSQLKLQNHIQTGHLMASFLLLLNSLLWHILHLKLEGKK